jgi:tryptophan halogenase
MHVCIVGAGAAGWIAAHHLKNLTSVDKVTIIGSPTIPSIGVGESTTGNFMEYIKNTLKFSEDEYQKFLVDIDAAIKYGVKYVGWSPIDFMNSFSQGNDICGRYSLGKKSPDESVDDYLMWFKDEIYNNQICKETDIQLYSLHFDANKFIAAMAKLAENEPKITFISDTVVESIYENNIVKQVTLSAGANVQADYFISCIGQTAFNQKVFRDEYISYSDILLTDTALFYPLPYQDKEKEFHPYTIAKTMKYGWRWITPTWNRIGTGYAFSSKHVSVEDAIKEFVNDIGDPTIVPNVVEFKPRKVKTVFKLNSCTLGMASGFLEPLDAPGLCMTFFSLYRLEKILNEFNTDNVLDIIAAANTDVTTDFNNWASFILCQYKTASRNDTAFWKDHKLVKFDFYDKLIEDTLNPSIVNNDYPTYNSTNLEPAILYNTIAGKGITWDVRINYPLIKPNVDKTNINFISHYDFFKKLHDNKDNLGLKNDHIV